MKNSIDVEALIRERDNCKKTLKNINAKYLEKIEELSLIRRIGDEVNEISDFPSVCKSIVAIIQQELDPDNCSVMIVDDEKGELVIRAAKGPYDDEARFIDDNSDEISFKIGESVAGHVARYGKSILVQDVLADERFLTHNKTRVEIRSLMSIPLIVGERVIAVLNLSHREANYFNSDKERILSIIANSSAVALENTRLYEKLCRARDRLVRENVDLKKELLKKYSPESIIGSSKNFAEILKKVEKVAGVDVNVLVTGESGTGKELIARTLHYNSPRAEGPFVALNCAALPDTLLESELFGIEKGVATGVEKRAGKFELAHGGTIFLDEIADMSLSTQAKILRILQEREFQRVGGSSTIKLDVRVISATNKNPEEEIKKGKFRQDLYYRLKVVDIKLPPLRQRRDDIPLLSNYFLRIYCKKHNVGEKWFSRDALDFLIDAPWKGNVRELENIVEQAVILSSAKIIGPDDLALTNEEQTSELKVFIPENRLNYKETIKEVSTKTEVKLIEKALAKAKNNKSKAARLLGIGRRTLLYKLEKM
jgi:Nif-specific regulatory protein